MKKNLLILLSALMISGGVATGEDLVKLELEYPKPMFPGTPKPIKVPNLEPLVHGQRPFIMVPPGTVNLAEAKEVTSSDDWPVIGELEYVTDGDRDGGDGYFVELGPELQWVQIDLDEEAEIYGILMWHYHAQPRVYFDVIVQISNDPEFKEGVITLFNNDFDNSAGMGKGEDPSFIESYEGRYVEAQGQKARYVRLYSAGNTSDTMNHYIEVEVYGREN